MKILLADDEREMTNAVAAILRHSGYDVDTVYDGRAAFDNALTGSYDAILLDVMMPGLSGLDVLKSLRDYGITVPIMMLTAKSEVDDRIAGLDSGANDYLTKPFAMGELLARIRAMTRKTGTSQTEILKAGNLELNSKTGILSNGTDNIRLSGKELGILEMLMRAKNKAVSADEFISRVWGDQQNDTNVLWVYLSNLRKKLASLNATVEIKATRNIGYSLEEISS